LKDQNINTLWIQLEEDLVGWQQRVNKVEELLIGDVEYESVIWRNGLENASAEEIVAAFDTDSTFSPQLKHLYGISPTRATAARHGALDFINDVFFALPTEDIARTRRSAGKTTYQYLIDQVNPWQSSSRAHHAVDLLFLFGAYDLSFNPAAEIVKNQIQDRWIDFVNGGKPWDGGKRFAFGPYGGVGEVEDSEFAARRRQRHFEVLREMDRATLHTMFAKLAAGRISLLN
jgi:carboxylesterase type B